MVIKDIQSFFEASYDSMVFDWMMMVVSPFLTLLEVVVIVRVTLQPVRAILPQATMPAIATISIIFFIFGEF